MVSQPVRTHIVLECDGSGNMLCVFPDAADRLKWFWEVKIDTGHEISILTINSFFLTNHMYRFMNNMIVNRFSVIKTSLLIDTLKSIFSCFPSQNG